MLTLYNEFIPQSIPPLSKLNVQHAIEYGPWRLFLSHKKPDIRRLLHRTLQAAATLLPARLMVDILWTDDAKSHSLNLQWRQKDKPTNILSFPSNEWQNPPQFLPVIPLGDLVLSYETIAKEANHLAVSLEAHTKHLLVHGMLHLLGFTHDDDEDTATMHDWEIKILQQHGAPDPYLPYLTDE